MLRLPVTWASSKDQSWVHQNDKKSTIFTSLPALTNPPESFIWSVLFLCSYSIIFNRFPCFTYLLPHPGNTAVVTLIPCRFEGAIYSYSLFVSWVERIDSYDLKTGGKSIKDRLRAIVQAASGGVLRLILARCWKTQMTMIYKAPRWTMTYGTYNMWHVVDCDCRSSVVYGRAWFSELCITVTAFFLFYDHAAHSKAHRPPNLYLA